MSKTLVLAAEHAVAAADDAKRQAAAARFRERPLLPDLFKGSGEDRFNGVCLLWLFSREMCRGLTSRLRSRSQGRNIVLPLI